MTSDLPPPVQLRLYIAGQAAQSLRAVANMHRICTDVLAGKYELLIIDLYQQPHLAKSEQIFAIPALIKHWPLPKRMVIGDMSDTQRVLDGLAIVSA